MTVPSVIIALFGVDTTKIDAILSLTSISGLIIYSVLIVMFTFIYSHIQIKPGQIAENFTKNGQI